MNSSIFNSLKDILINSSSINNRSVLELCIIELSSGNFSKAIDLSEEIIKKDINDSAGWALKALSQAHLFDYENNLYLLKSSLSSIDEFKMKTSLSAKDICTIESVFVTTVLEKTIILVSERIDSVIELRRKAMAEKAKAGVAAISAVMSAYAGSNSKSDVGKILGYGGAIAGATAMSSFNSNATLLKNASKGVFGVAIANISMTIDSAKALKNSLEDLDHNLKEEAAKTLKNWLTTLALLYQQVVENLIAYGNELGKGNVFIKTFRVSAFNLIHEPETTQFLYLSNKLGFTNNPNYLQIETRIDNLNKTTERDLKKSINKMHLISLLSGIAVGLALENVIVMFVLWFILYAFFVIRPIGRAAKFQNDVYDFLIDLKKINVSKENVLFTP